MKKYYKDIQELLHNNLLRDEEPNTKILIDEMQNIKSRGYFSKSEFLKMCKWKDPRERRRSDWHANTESEIRHTSTQAFSINDEYTRIILLDQLKGVGIATASAILTLTNPQIYGVIDKRVWEVLFLYDEVNYNSEGINLRVQNWIDYLPKIRRWATEFEVNVRNIERSLFEHHKKIQEGRLYK